MSTSPVLALRKAIRARLLANGALVRALGGPKVYDEAPRGTDAPYVLFMDAQMRDWSGVASRGAEQFFSIAVVTVQRGLQPALMAAQQIVDAVDEASLALEGHTLVDLRFISMDTKRDASGRFARVSILFRATTEYL